MLKQSVNSSFETPLSHGIMHERHIFYSTFSTVILLPGVLFTLSRSVRSGTILDANALMSVAERSEGGNGRICGEA
jgi:hypothetical protein